MVISDVIMASTSIVASVVASLGSVALAVYLSRRTSQRDRQRDAYKHFITAAETFTLRAMLFRWDRSFARSMIQPTINEVLPTFGTLALVWKLKAGLPAWDLVEMLADHIKSAPTAPQTVSDEILLQGLEGMQERWLKVRLVGSEQVMDSGKSLIDASEDLIKLLLSRPPALPWLEKQSWEAIALKREAMQTSLSDFIVLAREQHRE